jgi:hypothetical protein
MLSALASQFPAVIIENTTEENPARLLNESRATCKSIAAIKKNPKQQISIRILDSKRFSPLVLQEQISTGTTMIMNDKLITLEKCMFCLYSHG